MSHQLGKIVEGIEKIKQFEHQLHRLNKKNYFSVLASLESLEPDFVQEEMPTGDVIEKVRKLNSMLNNRAANALLTTLEYVSPLIVEYLKEVPEQYNPDSFQIAKDKISQSFKSNPIKPFHSLSDMQRENVLITVKKHFDLSDTPNIDLVNVLIDGYNAGAPKLNIARQANINFVVKQDYEIKEEDQRILDLELVYFLKHRIRELFITMDKLKFDKSMTDTTLAKAINDFLNSGNPEKLSKLKQIVSESSIAENTGLESHNVSLDRVNVLPITSEIFECVKDIYSPGLKEIINKFATVAQGEPFSELITEQTSSIYQNNVFGHYIEFLHELNILTSALGLLARVLKVNTEILSVATATMNELDVKFDTLFKELLEVTETDDSISTEAFDWLKNVFAAKVKKFNIKELPKNLRELIALESSTNALIQYIKQQGKSNFDKNRDSFIATISDDVASFTDSFSVKTLKNMSGEEIENWITTGLLDLTSKATIYESLFGINREYILKLDDELDELTKLVDVINSDIGDFKEKENATVEDLWSISNNLTELVNGIKVFNGPVKTRQLETFYTRYFSGKGEKQKYTLSFAKEACKSNVSYIEASYEVYNFYHDFYNKVYAEIEYIMENYPVLDKIGNTLFLKDYLVIEECLSIAKETIKDLLTLEKAYGKYVFILLAYLEAIRG